MPDVKVTWDCEAIEAMLIAQTKRLFCGLDHTIVGVKVDWNVGGHMGNAAVTIECIEKESK